MRLISLACMITVVLFSACSSDDGPDPDPYKSGPEAIAAFRSFFYRNGKINALKHKNFLDTEWAIPIGKPEDTCMIFNLITGMDVKLTDTYSYSYKSTDGKCTIRMEGKRIPENAIYGTMYINIPECPEITKIILAKPEFFENTNEWEDIITATNPSS
ncbi:hypothetical protein M2137_001917 [Parabacteroides sp. PFB2-10]|uniref:hypothetical protein n=1 Tax=Parabacteroides sp. PFB2-10 TaxID=1742405 RepID=UPI002476E68A|nr:hypothetical protein [Parabacteroides sp. PFB2-10]MDH6313130.1 hypothetical protein [Parabacteroides sp. PFB2-10]MDL2244109.1 hypothetical protein [Parabacteroides sp. OttesenSCG-928-J18]